jgi:amidohydrolase
LSSDLLRSRVVEAIRGLAPDLIEICRAIHAKPELGFQERFASNLLCNTLEGHGLRPLRRAFGLETSFSAEFGGAGTPIVCILSEYDALPQLGHACGHNIIATAGLGAALGLAAVASALPGRVRYLGAPAEENGGGKELMARLGAFDGVDCAMMVHPASADLPGMRLIAKIGVTIRYHGRAAHASSSPEAGLNALDAIVFSYQAIAALRQHLPPGHRVHGIITRGGDAPNVVPDFAEAHFQLRAPDLASLSELRRRIEGCISAGATATGTRADALWDDVVYADMRNNWPLARAYQRNAEALGRVFGKFDDIPLSAAASSDMGNVSYRTPSIQPMISMAPAGVKHHHRDFATWAASDPGMAAAIDGAIAMALTTVDYLTDPELRATVQKEFDGHQRFPSAATAPAEIATEAAARERRGAV